MRRILLFLLSFVCLLGCSGKQQGAALEQAARPPADSLVADTATMSGVEAYESTCAHCHDTGLNGAPVTKNPADWENRSPLWQAVLMEHAKDGYFSMPAKGGNPDLPDLTVSAAAEYMLEITFPNLPPD